MAMRERRRDQLTTASAISAWRAESSPITTVQTKHFGGQLQRIPLVQPHEQKANVIGWTRRSAFGRAGSALRCSPKRVRCIEAAVA